MSDRQKWREFICSPNHAGRHLSSIGRAVIGATGDPVDTAELSSFLKKLSEGDDDVSTLADAVDLIGGDYYEFLMRDLVRVLDHLSNEMIHRDEIVGPALRGNPRWDRTIIGRMTVRLRPGLYVTRTAHRSFNLPENLLLRWLVDELLGAIREIARRVGAAGVHSSLQAVQAQAEEVLRHHWFTEIPSSSTATFAMLLAAERHRRPEYRRAAALAKQRLQFSARDPSMRWYAILMLLAANWLEPVSEDDLFELYVLVQVIDIIAEELGFGSPTEYGLVIRDRGHVAQFENNEGRIRIYFDQSPSIFTNQSGRYRPIVNQYLEVTGNERRPDIIVRFEPASGEPPTCVFVEVKKSTDGGYISDSVYKAFAYLHDFQDLWPNAQPRPKLILALPGSVSRKPGSSPSDVLIAAGDNRDELRFGLVSGLGIEVATEIRI